MQESFRMPERLEDHGFTMKRFIATIVFGALAGIVLAQAPFTIVRPADGAKVRETIRVQIPKNSIPEGAYVGIFLDGKFVEATILDLNGKFYEYRLDTKARRIADGNHKLEVVLYADYGDKPRIVDRSSVDITVANSTSIAVPANGFALRYRFTPGAQFVYGLDIKFQLSTLTEAQARMGSRAAQIDVEGESVRMLYAVDNAYGNGDGLLRIQPLPDRGKDYAVLTTAQDPEPRKYMDYEMAPLYMRLTNTGLEQWGSIPTYFPIDGSPGGDSRLDLYAAFPLPTLPTKRVKPGDAWQTRFQWGQIDLEKRHEAKTITTKALARGELLGVEWEMGHPCAKIRHSIAAGQAGNMQVRGNMGGNRYAVEETIWFALDKGMVVRAVRDITEDVKVTEAAPSGGGGGGGTAAGSDAGAPSRGGVGGAGGRPGGGRGPGGRDGDDRSIRQASGSGAMGPPAGVQGAGSSRGGGGGLGQGGRQGAPAVGGVRYNRTRYQISMRLEQ
jgi:hypothetical protein